MSHISGVRSQCSPAAMLDSKAASYRKLSRWMIRLSFETSLTRSCKEGWEVGRHASFHSKISTFAT